MIRITSSRWLGAACALAASGVALAEKVELTVGVERQQTEVWCWAAAVSMALRLYDTPQVGRGSYQCGIVSVTFPNCRDDCGRCITAIGPMTNVVSVIQNYVAFLRANDAPVINVIDPGYKAYPTFEGISRAIRSHYPVIVGISPNGRPARPELSQHAIIVSGFADEVDSRGRRRRFLIVNDPYVYPAGQTPYERAGGFIDRRTGKAVIEWEAARDRLNLTSAVFIYKAYV